MQRWERSQVAPRGLALALALALAACSPAPGGGFTADVPEPDMVDHDTPPKTDAPPAREDAPPGYSDVGPNVQGVDLRRLDRLAYNNMVRDLFGVDSRPADAFPPDPVAHGFDNLADHLSISPLLLEYYAKAAETLAEDALAEPTVAPFEVLVEVETLEAPDDSIPIAGVGVGVYSLWPLEATVVLPEAAEYTFEVLAGKQNIMWNGSISPQMAILVDDETLEQVTVSAPSDEPEVYSATLTLDPGPHRFSVRVVNPQYTLDIDDGFWGVIVAVDRYRVTAPDLPVTHETPRDAILLCDPAASSEAACGADILRAFARRAWRRPPTEAEIAGLIGFITTAVADGEGFERGVQTALSAALLSPHFLFLVEDVPDGQDPEMLALTSHQVAARLAHFLWSALPDEALFTAADADALQTAEQVEAQARRMLDDPRALTLFDDVADQWLLARKVESIQPNPTVFNTFDDALRQAMADEVRHFFRSFADGSRSIFDLIGATDLFVNDVLAEHYDMPPVGPDFVHLETHDAPRGGILRQAGVLAANSHPYRTSPTRRGQWILEGLLCAQIGAPPPGEALFFDPLRLDEDKTDLPKLAQHFTDADCAGCHVLMDPLGLALENYDAVGRWRPMDESLFEELESVFEADDILRSTDDVIEAVLNDPAFPRCVVQKLYTYALGRAPLASDDPVIDGLVEALAAADYSFGELVILIATSAPFRERLPASDEAREGEGS